jgi:X-X-X-Leu-X-X-Gly heptad repeat protein
MSEANGHEQSRLDRIEAILERHSTMIVSIEASIERQERANEKAHDLFKEEDKRLLTSQILMNDAMTKMADGMTKMTDSLQKMADGMTKLEVKMEETTGKLNALIDTVDGIIRRVPPAGGTVD